ncbi:hypothetical protein MIV007R [Invertebrate iridescent virus 3]|uniref:Uncharacterized protein 007R n=1 Tax=Invertebrate iridescent virus 3 TaxID=345201 RepID=007R_IIV3|nr:hypothetical protein MIV007R [Invertebrate iridescent virus 3]Q197F3.1 RecName: Full=Uncharacterized protein 007R [Invertebrate iridescent virus 3]ABF82037.1 hypothetical protein MIV007R [Invertebrate iridescent virus 3]
MEAKNITIDNTTYNFFKFYNINQPLTNLKYLNSERLCFSNAVMGKIVDDASTITITYHRVYFGISGPKPRQVADLGEYYDVNELLNYDTYTKTQEFAQKYNSLVKPTIDAKNWSGNELVLLVGNEWYCKTFGKAGSKNVFLYNMIPTIYRDEPQHQEQILKKFMFFNATKNVEQNPNFLDNVPEEYYHLLLPKSWVEKNLSDKYRKIMETEHKPLVFSCEPAFSFGLCRNTQDKNESYQLSLCLYEREKPRDAEIVWAAKYDELAAMVRDYLKKTPEFKKYRSFISCMKGLSWKNNEIGDKDGPKLYPKVIFNRKKGEFVTIFTKDDDVEPETIEDPRTILDRRCVVQAALRLESVFVHNKVAIQLRINDVLISEWKEASSKPQPLILRRHRFTKPSSSVAKSTSPSLRNSGSDESDLNQSDSDKEDERVVPVPKTKRIVKTVKLPN